MPPPAPMAMAQPEATPEPERIIITNDKSEVYHSTLHECQYIARINAANTNKAKLRVLRKCHACALLQQKNK